jgi:hypothetical protein
LEALRITVPCVLPIASNVSLAEEVGHVRLPFFPVLGLQQAVPIMVLANLLVKREAQVAQAMQLRAMARKLLLPVGFGEKLVFRRLLDDELVEESSLAYSWPSREARMFVCPRLN